MFSFLKKINGFEAIGHYFTDRPFMKKMGDLFFIAAILLVWGFASGKLHIPITTPVHTVEGALHQSDQVQHVLRQHQSQHLYSFVSHFRFHNGVSSLNGSYSFTKFSMTEYASLPYIAINPLEWRDLPISIDFNLMAALTRNECYTKTISINDPLYLQYLRTNVNDITACPVFDRRNNLSGFIMAGVSEHKSIDTIDIKLIAQTVERL